MSHPYNAHFISANHKLDFKDSDTITTFLSRDHERCDRLYADGEAALMNNQREAGARVLREFDACLRRHLFIEEEVFFPFFENVTGITQGPTQVMRMEHEQMRNILSRMMDAIQDDDVETALDAGDTLLLLMQQHNMKEEGMLYPMADHHLGNQVRDLLEQISAIEEEYANT